MTCQDCVHYEVCLFHINGNEYEKCCHFKPKSRFVELPCEVGQTVWFIRNGIIIETWAEKIVLKHRGLHIKLECNAMYETSINSIGKTVFLSRELAEKALAERSKE